MLRNPVTERNHSKRVKTMVHEGTLPCKDMMKSTEFLVNTVFRKRANAAYNSHAVALRAVLSAHDGNSSQLELCSPPRVHNVQYFL